MGGIRRREVEGEVVVEVAAEVAAEAAAVVVWFIACGRSAKGRRACFFSSPI